MPVHKTFQGQTVWDGDVEVNLPKTDTAYARSTSSDTATTPLNAVKMSIVAESEKGKV